VTPPPAPFGQAFDPDDVPHAPDASIRSFLGQDDHLGGSTPDSGFCLLIHLGEKENRKNPLGIHHSTIFFSSMVDFTAIFLGLRLLCSTTIVTKTASISVFRFLCPTTTIVNAATISGFRFLYPTTTIAKAAFCNAVNVAVPVVRTVNSGWYETNCICHR
jgi:hypothetical protein